MPIVKELMDNLVKQYGPERGKRVYYAMEAEGKGPFSQSGKHHALHEAWAKKNGVPAIGTTRHKKKPASPKQRRASTRGAKRRR